MRRSLEWLYPGLGIKRWLLLAGVGGVLLVYSAIFAVGVLWSEQLMGGLGMGWLHDRHWAAVLLAFDGVVFGATALFIGARKALLVQRTGPETAAEIRAAGRLARGPRIVAVGGGNGLAALLRGLKVHTSNLTAVVTMADDGGSSGLLRRDMGMPPPGDLRNCLVALADDESMMSQLFQYRFPDDGGLQGHSFGNLFMAALAEVTGDFERAVQESTQVLKVRGRVLPSTLDDVVLHAQLEGGGQVSGQSTITAAERLPRRVWLTPAAPRPLPQAIAALRRADLVVLGPGSLYTSVIPNLLIPEVPAAIKENRGLVVYVCNVMTQPGETDGYTAADHLDALYRHGLAGLIDFVLVNDPQVSPDLVASYRRFGARPVVVDEDRLRDAGVKVTHAQVAAESSVVRHDSARLAQALMRMVR
jgi:uncharacterized cofD-like protein